MYINDLNTHLRNKYGQKLYKVALDGGMTCPNRDGSIGRNGCIFCSAGGSGEFAADRSRSITEQIEQAQELIARKSQGDLIAYFQAYTNTYAPVERLRELYTEAICHPKVKVISIATRPDCVGEEVVQLLTEINRRKPVWVELGLQTAKEETASFIRRGYRNEVFESAVKRLAAQGIEVIVHVILGLPGESEEDILETIHYINRLPVQGIKLQLLHVLKGTDLEICYREEGFSLYTMEEYAEILFHALEHLRQDIVVHRLTGDGPKRILVAPLWSANKRQVMNYIHREMKNRNIIQGAKAMVTGGFVCQ